MLQYLTHLHQNRINFTTTAQNIMKNSPFLLKFFVARRIFDITHWTRSNWIVHSIYQNNPWLLAFPLIYSNRFLGIRWVSCNSLFTPTPLFRLYARIVSTYDYELYYPYIWYHNHTYCALRVSNTFWAYFMHESIFISQK